MPSARELLEQADALMRRNRSPLMDDIPVLTDAIPEVPPGRPMRLKPAPPESNAPDTIPMLTESVSPAEAPPAVPAPSAKGIVEEGEPSDWLQIGGAEPSVIGEAPDSIAIVPEFGQDESEVIEVEPPPDVEDAFDEELAQRATVSAAPVAPPPVEASPPAAPPTDRTPSAWEIDTVIDAPEKAGAIEEIALESVTDAAPAEPFAEPVVEAVGEPVVEAVGEPVVEAVGEPVIEAVFEPVFEPFVEPVAGPVVEAVVEPVVEAVVEPVVLPGPSAAERQAAEDARWASMAEEIRMQVLQRIDLFTDTGLRDQLGARLQPIVDRASADLVATINQHVGDLLRAYVAEAIEREIDNWKRNN